MLIETELYGIASFPYSNYTYTEAKAHHFNANGAFMKPGNLPEVLEIDSATC